MEIIKSNDKYNITKEWGNSYLTFDLTFEEMREIYLYVERLYNEEDLETTLQMLAESCDEHNQELATRFDELKDSRPNLENTVIDIYRDNMEYDISNIWNDNMISAIKQAMRYVEE